MRTAVSRALKGDYKFLMAVLAFIRLSGLSDVAGDALVAGTDPAADETILADFLRRQGVVIPTASSVPGKSHRTTKKANAREDGDESS